MSLITINLLSEGCRCGLDMKLGWMDSTWMYIPFSLMIEASLMRRYHNKSICCQKGLDTTLGEFRGDGLYLGVLPIDEIIR